MNKQQLDWLKSLPNADSYGTLQSILLRDDVNTVQFEKALCFLVQNLMSEKEQLVQEGKKMSKILKDSGLYHKILED